LERQHQGFRLPKRLSLILGLAGIALSLGYIAWNILTTGVLSSPVWQQSAIWLEILVVGSLFGAGLILPALAWFLLVRSTAETALSVWLGIGIYAVSQLYKYLPTNLMHHVGRYYMLQRKGVGGTPAVWGSVAEVAILVASSLLVALVFGAPLIEMGRQASGINLVLLGGVLVAIACIGIILWKRPEALDQLFKRRVASAALAAFALHTLFRVFSGVLFWWFCGALAGDGAIGMPGAVSLWAAAWTIGFVTPGASAGLGVRDALLIAGLTGLGAATGEATVIALGFRLATTLGDIVFAAGGWVISALARREARA